MATHPNHDRLTVNPGGNWRLYTNTLPDGATPMGTITRGVGDTGALARLQNGAYVQINAGIVRALDGRKVAAALGTAGRPAKMPDGRRVNVYLDSESIAIATRLGDGNLSEGIRRAVRGRPSEA